MLGRKPSSAVGLPFWEQEDFDLHFGDEFGTLGHRHVCHKGGPQQTVQKNEPWEGQQAYLKKGFEGAERDVLNRPVDFFPGQTYANFSPETNMALGAATNRAMQGSPLLDVAQDETGRTIKGEYLTPGNPYMDAVSGRVMRTVAPGVDAEFARAGRGNSPLHDYQKSLAVADAIAPMAFGSYESERGRMQNAANQAPQLAREDYYDIGQLGQVGAAREGLQEREIADAIQRFNFEQNEPTNRLGNYMNLVTGNYGGTTTSTTPTSSNPLATIMGVGSSAAGIGSAAFGGPDGSGFLRGK